MLELLYFMLSLTLCVFIFIMFGSFIVYCLGLHQRDMNYKVMLAKKEKLVKREVKDIDNE